MLLLRYFGTGGICDNLGHIHKINWNTRLFRDFETHRNLEILRQTVIKIFWDTLCLIYLGHTVA